MMKLKKVNVLPGIPVLFYVFVCSFGVLIAFYPTLMSGFSFLQTDPGDPRLNNYFLEHSFQLLANINYSGGLWSPTFFYPYEQVLAFSDNLFGSAPVYWLFRSFLSSSMAFQLWMIAVCILNFASFVVLMRSFRVGHVLSALGAFLFAFSIPRIMSIGHQQLLPQFFTPLVLLTLWNFVKQPTRKRLTLLLLLTYLQVLAGIYLGWFLLFSLPIFFGIAYILDSKARTTFLAYWRSDRRAIVAITLAWVALMLLTLFPYLKARQVLGPKPYSEVDTMLPRLDSWFSVPPGSVLSSLLTWTSKDLPMMQEHYMFAGFTVVLLTILSMYTLFNVKNALTIERALIVKICLFIFIIIFCLSLRLPSGLSLWRIVYAVVPGASVIRAVTRIWTISYFYLLFAVILCFDSLLHAVVAKKRLHLAIVSMLCVIGVSEQIVLNIPSYEKAPVTKEVTELRELMKKNCDFAYVLLDNEKLYYVNQLSAMWAGIEANVPVLNGYSGNSPPDYPVTSSMDPYQAISWLGEGKNGRLCTIVPRGQEETEKNAFTSIGASVSKSSDNFTSFAIQLPISNKFAQEIHSAELPMNATKVGKTVKLPVIVKNKSNFVWNAEGVQTVRFSYHWLDSNNNMLVFEGERTDLPENVAPQSAVALNAWIKLPEQPGEYILLPTMVQENVSWFDSVDRTQPVKIRVNVTLPTGEKWFGQQIQLLVESLKSGKVGETIKIPVSVKNTSNFVWDSASANPVNFSYNWFDSNGSRVVLDGERTALPKSLAPQDSEKLNAVIRFPARPGNYILTLTMVQESVAWFSDKGAQSLKIPVTVTSQ